TASAGHDYLRRRTRSGGLFWVPTIDSGGRAAMPSDRNDLPLGARRAMDLAQTDPQLRELIPDPEVQAALRMPGASHVEVVAAALDGYAKRPAIGTRAYEVELDRETGRRQRRYLPRFETVTYGDLHDRIKSVATAWRRHEAHRVDPGDFVCI